MPFRVSQGRAYGPGSYDMKSGLVIALFAAEVLRTMRVRPSKRLVFLWTSDEEIGSESSRAVIEKEARRSDAVLVLEPASGPDGRLKTARKGVGEIELIVTGRAARSQPTNDASGRSEERRVGKECRSRWSPYH